MDGQHGASMGSAGSMWQQSSGGNGLGVQPLSNSQPAMMQGDNDVQQAGQAFGHSHHSQHQSFIDQAADILDDSDPDWHMKDEAYQRKFLRSMRLEMVDRQSAFGLDRSHENFKTLLRVAHANLKRDYEPADNALFDLTYNELVQWSAHNFQFWKELNRDQRFCALGKWDEVLNRVSFEDPHTRRFDRLVKVLRVMQEKSRIFDQEEIDLDRAAALAEQASDLRSGKTVFELADEYYKNTSLWTTKPKHYQGLFLNRLLSTPTTGVVEQGLGESLHKVLEQRLRFSKFDEKMRNEQGKYWPEPSYDQPDSPLGIHWNIQYHRIYRPWNRDEAIQRFTRAWQDLSTKDFPYEHLPCEVALLLVLPRINFPKLSQPQLPPKKSEEERPDNDEACKMDAEDESNADMGKEEVVEEEEEQEEEDEDEDERERGSRTHVPSKGDVPFLPDPYPYKITDVKNHATWTELQEFLAYVYGVDEGEMAERVVTPDGWNARRNLIRKRIAYKRRMYRILDPDTIPVRKGKVTEIGEHIVAGGTIGSHVVLPLTDEQLLFNVTWDIDIWQGTMKQDDGADDAPTYTLPPPREIDSEMLRKLLSGLGRQIPTMDWLITNMNDGVAGAETAIAYGSDGFSPAARPVGKPMGDELTQPARRASDHTSHFPARPNAQIYLSNPQGYQVGTRISSFEDGTLGNVLKKHKSPFFGTILNDSDEATFPAFEPSSIIESQQPRRGAASLAGLGQGGMRSSQLSLRSPATAPQMRLGTILSVDDNGRASIVERLEDNVEQEDDFLPADGS
ncbi:hypothetical protein FKW77_003875 [Venturia effusa]|uniref:Uncharacterized protein n=1 Tax=Venturia effusa TaxID=50376 RepID=A0A517L316_9PEZI|nr:hypothetical protein FKW77_003875 [Venturia effusa]